MKVVLKLISLAVAVAGVTSGVHAHELLGGVEVVLSDFPTAERVLSDVPPSVAEIPAVDIPQPLGRCVVNTDGYGGVIQPNLDDPWSTSSSRGDGFLLFAKFVMTRGIIIAAMANVSDTFFEKVIETLNQMIPEKLNEAEQIKMMDFMARKRTLIPILYGYDGYDDLSSQEKIQAESIMDTYSVCDIIFELGPDDSDGQPMEVVEHLLHSINMVGLHYLKFDSWGISRNSILYEQMQNAMDDSYYNVDDLKEEIDDEDELVRVQLQEYGYWAIATWMDLVVDYGPQGSREWSLFTPALFQEKQPEMYHMCQSDLQNNLLGLPANLEDYKNNSDEPSPTKAPTSSQSNAGPDKPSLTNAPAPSQSNAEPQTPTAPDKPSLTNAPAPSQSNAESPTPTAPDKPSRTNAPAPSQSNAESQTPTALHLFAFITLPLLLLL